MGTFFTLLILVMMILYTMQKGNILANRKNPDIKETLLKDALDESFVYDASKGLAIAVGLTAYDGGLGPTLDPSIGTIEYKAYEWGVNEENGEYYSTFSTIESHYCTKEEIGLEGDSSHFMAQSA